MPVNADDDVGVMDDVDGNGDGCDTDGVELLN